MPRLAIVAVILVVTSTSGAQPAAPVALRGRVVAGDDSAVALRGARVFVIGLQPDSEPLFTDGDGRFVAGVPTAYTLKITKAGFAPAIVSGSATAPADIQVRLARGAVVSGVVVDELGFPVNDAGVRARWLDPIAGASAAGLVEFTANTDEQGRYRIGSLPSGRFALHTERAMPRVMDMAHEPDPVMQARRAALNLALAARLAPMSDVVTVETRAGQEASMTLLHSRRAVAPPDAPIGGYASGIVLDEFGEPAEGVSVRLRRIRYVDDRSRAQPATATLVTRTDDRGYFRLFYVLPGRYLLEAAIEEAGYAPVFYPGVTAIAAAVPVVVGRTQEVSGLNVQFTRTREARVFGFAISAGGGALRGNVSLTATQRSAAVALPPRFASTNQEGVFEFLNVPPGEYVLRATRGARSQLEEFGLQIVRVDGPDVAPITIAATATATITGRIVLDGGAAGLSPRSFTLTAVPDGDSGPEMPVAPALVSDDGTFAMRGLAGLVRFAAGNGGPAGWWLKSVDVGGSNAVEIPVRFAGRTDSRTDVTAVFSASVATIAGRVTDDRGQPVDDYHVVVFAADRGRWFARSPYVRITRGPEVDGSFSVRGLPPGDYLVAAVDAIDGDGAAGEWQNPDFLDGLRTRADRASLDENERAVMNLRLLRTGR